MSPKQPTAAQFQKLRKDVDMLLEAEKNRLLREQNFAEFQDREYQNKKRKIAGWAGTGIIVLVLLIQMIIQFIGSRHQ